MSRIKRFYELGELGHNKVEDLLKKAKSSETSFNPRRLEGKVLATLFLNPSLRTLTSFQASMARVGGSTFVVSPEMSIHGLETMDGIVMDGRAAEHIREAVPAIASYADVIGIRALAKGFNLAHDVSDADFIEIQSLCDIPVINMESAIHHPCQSLADWKSLDDMSIPRKGGKIVVSWVYHPDPLSHSVPGDTIHMAAMRGMNVTLLRPSGFELSNYIMDRARETAALTGGSVVETDDRDEALKDANVLYVRSWMSSEDYGKKLADRNRRNELRDWCVDHSWFKHTHDNCRFMHSLPVRRGVEVLDEVLDSRLSAVTLQARNRMYTQMAVLDELLRTDKQSS
ncbi:MAG: hypothetical protein KTR18_17040 [Acidiferrobacterales bacterium]|nr:hypothetical protein [Acidiferrobacterales bacterium]